MKYKLQIGVNNPVLRSISEEIPNITPEIQSFGEDLMNLMYERDGVGLAAPQVGRNIRMIAVTKRKRNKIIKEILMINPKIMGHSEDKSVDEEACLSLPDEIGNVKRYQSIMVTYQDLKGNIQKRRFKNMDARVVQHEIDHLDGILFVDKLV